MLLQSVSAQAAPDTAPPADAASSGPAQDSTPGDPWEHLNRAIYRFDQALDRTIIRPAAMGYAKVVPAILRNAIRHFLDNIHEPVIIANDILQLHPTKAVTTTARFVVNSTGGLGGLLDVATGAGLPHHDNSFGNTLGRYGVGPGPYLYLPVAGPSTIRDLVGMGVDTALDPLYWTKYPNKAAITISRAVVGGLDTRARVDSNLTALTSDATDPYATLRSVYLQNQQSQIDGGKGQTQALPDFDDPEAAPPKPATAGATPVDSPPNPPAPDAAPAAAPATDAPHTP